MNKALKRFLAYSMVGGGTFLFDLGMLYVAVSILRIPLYIATPSAFLIAVSCNYVLSRQHVFKGTTRSWHGGYGYFALVAMVGAGVTTVLVSGLVSLFSLQYLVARILTAGVVGFGNYFFNLYFNFKMAGIHTD